MVPNRYLYCTGDPIVDIFTTGYLDTDGPFNFKATDEKRCYGGALNTWKNAEALLGNMAVQFFSPTGVLEAEPLLQTEDLYTIRRYLLELKARPTGQLALESSGVPISEKLQFYASTDHLDVFLTIRALYNNRVMTTEFPEVDRVGLVISDYNKGTVSKSRRKRALLQDFTNTFDFCIADSRYRSLDPTILDTSKFNIWHATGKEYQKDFASNFDLVFWTNGPHDIKILRQCENNFYDLSVPVNIKNVVDECGAGDTFTAAVAAYLLSHCDPIHELSVLDSLDLSKDACEFAITCCKDVISRPFTSITTIKMRDICTLQTSRRSSPSLEESLEIT